MLTSGRLQCPISLSQVLSGYSPILTEDNLANTYVLRGPWPGRGKDSCAMCGSMACSGLWAVCLHNNEPNHCNPHVHEHFHVCTQHYTCSHTRTCDQCGHLPSLPGPCSGSTQLSASALVCHASSKLFWWVVKCKYQSLVSPLWGGQDRQVIYQALLKIVPQPLPSSPLLLSHSWLFLFFSVSCFPVWRLTAPANTALEMPGVGETDTLLPWRPSLSWLLSG